MFIAAFATSFANTGCQFPFYPSTQYKVLVKSFMLYANQA